MRKWGAAAVRRKQAKNYDASKSSDKRRKFGGLPHKLLCLGELHCFLFSFAFRVFSDLFLEDLGQWRCQGGRLCQRQLRGCVTYTARNCKPPIMGSRNLVSLFCLLLSQCLYFPNSPLSLLFLLCRSLIDWQTTPVGRCQLFIVIASDALQRIIERTNVKMI